MSTNELAQAVAGPRPAARPAHALRRWTIWLIPKPFDAVSSLLYLGVLVLFFYERWLGLYNHPWQWGQAALISAAVLALLLIDRAEVWQYGSAPPSRVAVGLFAARVLLIELIAQLDDFSFSPFLYLLVPFVASLYFGMRACYVVAGVVWLVFLGKLTLYQVKWYSLQADTHSALIFTIGLVFALAMAKVVTNERVSRARAEALLAELATSHRQLQSYAARIQELAATQERNRLAREIHDSLGHYLTVVNVQLEKALVFRDHAPDEADHAVREAKRLASEALRDVRRSVGALRDRPDGAPLALGVALAALVENLRGGACDITLRITGEESGFSDAARLAIYRAVQEALTNVQKHASAGAAEVDLRFEAAAATLSVRDDGRGFDPALLLGPPAAPAGGYGLRGVRERIALLGGTVAVDSQPGAGACLRLRIPRDAAPGRAGGSDER